MHHLWEFLKIFIFPRKINNWLDERNEINGNTMLIVGNIESELKFECAKEFENNIESASEDILCPIMLLGTPGCVGVGADSDQVRTIIRFGLSTRILNFIEEMGRCGRRNNFRNDIENFNLIFNVECYVCLNERLHMAHGSTNGNINTSSYDEILNEVSCRKLSQNSILRVL